MLRARNAPEASTALLARAALLVQGLFGEDATELVTRDFMRSCPEFADVSDEAGYSPGRVFRHGTTSSVALITVGILSGSTPYIQVNSTMTHRNPTIGQLRHAFLATTDTLLSR